MTELVFQGALTGVIATIGTDVWATIVRRVFGLPTANWALVGRWFGHMPKGVFVHRKIAESAPVANERAIGWIAHYGVGIVYGLAYLGIVRAFLPGTPTLLTALGFGIATVAAPWLLMQPGMGAGVFASRTPRPAMTRLVNLSMHTAYGLSLYAGWALIGVE